ncbi:MAG: hypothetical protein QMD46_11080 [Methanomicrobiales archaeon]|nr:hypothetical protein [Methanomicrobiales archaeon]MDI6876994.1 hypothetical protein [Methanomicrobiales archaeon]
MRCRQVIVLLAVLAVLVSPAPAHVPLEAGDNGSLASATRISDPTRSYAIYARLHEGSEAQYYALAMEGGEELRLSLMVPRAGVDAPDLVVMGPGIESSGSVPSSVEVPPGYGAVVVRGVSPEQAEYEPFTPSAIYEAAAFSREIEVPGTYYAVVLNPGGSGEYSLAVGYREEFTPLEWLSIPFDQIRIHLWEGQPLWLILSPLILVLLGGIGFALVRRRGGLTPFSLLAGLAGLLYIGTGGMTLLQMGIALSRTGFAGSALLTLVFAAVPILLGAAVLRLARKERPRSCARERVYLAVAGLLGLLSWAGLVIGPILALIAGGLPRRFS